MANALSMCAFSCLLGRVRVKSRPSGSKAMGVMAVLMFANHFLFWHLNHLSTWNESRLDRVIKGGAMFCLLHLGSLGLNWLFPAKSWDNENKQCSVIQVHTTKVWRQWCQHWDLNTPYAQELLVHCQPRMHTGLVRTNRKWPRER